MRQMIVLTLVLGSFLITGCDIPLQSKKGIGCDNKKVTEVLEGLLQKNGDAVYKVDTANIIVWDYNDVGRYTCKAKIIKTGEKSKSEIAPYLSLAYGIKDGGWVNYHTYITTADSSMFYVGLDLLATNK